MGIDLFDEKGTEKPHRIKTFPHVRVQSFTYLFLPFSDAERESPGNFLFLDSILTSFFFKKKKRNNYILHLDVYTWSMDVEIVSV